MKKFILFAVFAVITILAGVSCKKEKAPQKSAFELLTNNSSKQWMPTSLILNGTEAIEDCNKDDVYTFYANKSVTVDYHYKCYPTDSVSEKDAWDFSAAGKFKWISANASYEGNIDVLTESQFTLSGVTNGLSFSQTYTAK